MKKFILLVSYFFFITLSVFSGDSYSKIIDKVLPSTVLIKTLALYSNILPEGWENPFFAENNDDNNKLEFQSEGIGSGVIIKNIGSKYFILTNNHVVADENSVIVTLYDGKEIYGTVVGTDPKLDLAIVAIETAQKLNIAVLGNSDSARIGDRVFAIGAPLGYDFSVTSGIVSAVGRRHTDGTINGDFIQTDASINQGNSGGPLINTKGQVIGINTWLASPETGSVGLGFAIPSNNINNSVEEIIQNGSVVYPFLGAIIGNPLPGDIKSYGISRPGVLVFSIIPGQSAFLSGFQPGDFIVAINGEKISDFNDFEFYFYQLFKNQPATFTILRPYQDVNFCLDIDVKLSYENPKEDEKFVYWPGVNFTDLGEQGIFVYQSQSDGIIKLQLGDRIDSINGQKVENINDLYLLLNKYEDEIEITFFRNGEKNKEIFRRK